MDNPDEHKEQGGVPLKRGGRFWVPLGIIAIGGIMLARQMGAQIPDWLFTWQFLLIGIGIFSGLAGGFRGGGWLVMILVGSFFLVDQMVPGVSFHQYLWPIGLIAVGLFMLLRPKRKHWAGHDCSGRRQRRFQRMRERRGYPGLDSASSNFESGSKNSSSEDFIDITTVFGGIHKNVVSKDFKGGDITVFMGGTEINLSQADIQGTARLDITQVMGGTKLIVPPHWEIRSQLTSVFGNVEDKRQQVGTSNPDKLLILDGSSVFGGIEIRNY
ncbi:MAG: LiaF domain-containing protein [Puia sp.]